MKSGHIQIVIAFVLCGVMITFGLWRLDYASNLAKEVDNFYVEQFATNKTWVDSLNCDDVALVMAAGKASWGFEFKSRPNFERWYSEHECDGMIVK